MEWLAIAVLVLGTIYFAIHYRGFRRSLLFAVVGLILFSAISAVVAWIYSEREQQRRRTAATLIKAEQIEISGATLSIGLMGDLKAIVTNKSPHHLKELALKVTVTDCPNVSDKANELPLAPFLCNVVGEDIVRQYDLDIPSGQRRAFNAHPHFSNLPQLRDKEWSWHFAIVETIAEEGRR